MQLKDLKPCCKCGGSINPMFYRVTVQRFMLDQRAVQQNLGLMQMMGGSMALADVFSPTRNLGVPLSQLLEIVLCGDCIIESLSFVLDDLELRDPNDDGVAE